MPTTFTIDGKQINGKVKVKDWIRNGLDKEAIAYAEEFGRSLATGKKSEVLSTSQIRNVFGEVQRMRMKGFNEPAFLLLKPRLVYSTMRNGTDGSRDFKDVFEPAIDAVIEPDFEDEKQQRFERFADFFEAVLAYHRAFGGK